jgi:serine phosphatase RsbU (regulator of sigma subunit)
MLARDGTADFEEFVSMNATINGVKMSTRMIPAQNAASGGDWCEAIVLSENVIALSIGDVCGHGAESFHTMVATRAAIRESLHRHANPAHALVDASRFLRGYDAATYATALVALLDIESGRILFANAGHPPPLMTGLHGTDFLEFSDFDLPIGLVDECEPTLRIVHLPADSLLVLYTDGVTEHERNPIRGEAQLREAAQFAYHHLGHASAAVIERQMFLTGSNLDDVAILTARTAAATLPR